MKTLSDKARNWILIFSITALAIAMGCVFAACTKAQAESSQKKHADAAGGETGSAVSASATDETVSAEDNYSHWLSDHYSAEIYTREMWLEDLQSTLHLRKANSAESTFEQAYRNSIVDSEEEETYQALTRRYVAQTLVRALGYKEQVYESAVDLAGEKELQTACYYGYFLPDVNDMIYPDAVITADEYQAILAEVDKYQRLHGKHALSFGDSIMYGLGNHDRGIADITCEKYGMTVTDYSISGATFGVYKSKSHIANQIRTASRANAKPDMIFLDGGTNDIIFTELGKIAVGYNPKSFNEKQYAGGFETAAYLLKRYWPGVPVLYVRAHDMAFCDDTVEQTFGDLALTMAEKWDFEAVDIYNDTDFCAEIDYISEAYTFYREKSAQCDGIHPTDLGYVKYYIPPVSEKVDEMLGH